MDQSLRLKQLHHRVRACRKCDKMCGPPVHGLPNISPVMLIGQAPGAHEGAAGKPFAHTAGKTLFRWLKDATGADEDDLRELIYFSAVARCFPGKAKSGQGDRVPSPVEIANCAAHLNDEISVIKPKLIIAVGKVAIAEVLAAAGVTKTTTLEDVVGKMWTSTFHGYAAQVVALPHPSGVSRWPHTPTGKQRLAQALDLIRHATREIGL